MILQNTGSYILFLWLPRQFLLQKLLTFSIFSNFVKKLQEDMNRKNSFGLSGYIVDLKHEKIFKGTIHIENGYIKSIIRDDSVSSQNYILPGLIDSHIHIESSMLIPSEFARLAVVHGTVATVSDPHEIANVLGIDGIDYMINNGNKVPFKFFFGASACVPATPFETSGAKFGLKELDQLLARNDIKYLSEMMNFPGVISHSEFEMGKIAIAKKYGKPVDGHAPGIKGDDARKYAEAGVSTDHECFTIDEALEKIKYGMKIQIREGSAAKNFEALIGLMESYADKVLFCSDDKHPDDLTEGHINLMIKRAIAKAYDPIKILKSVIINPIEHYDLPVGTLQTGDPADIIMVDNLNDFNVLQTYIDGVKVAENGRTLIESVVEKTPNKFFATPIEIDDIAVAYTGGKLKVIEALDGELITKAGFYQPKVVEGKVISNAGNDLLKIVVYNRYEKARPSVAFIKNFGLKQGALASSVAHDSHNIVSVGTSDKAIVQAVNNIVEVKGGVSVVAGDIDETLPLPVAGLMSADDGFQVAEKYHLLDRYAHIIGSKLSAPFMTMSFMALLVIPQLKLSDKGLFDGKNFSFTPLLEERGD